ncbi:MAG: spermidine/putrescine transport system permease protein [Gammaproteobacteria bacterium]|jgi:spermidine/putrescine transport system permease protein
MQIPEPTKRGIDWYAMTWRMPVIVWQLLFFVGPLVFMIAMSFFLVKNYRMTEAFEMQNWIKMYGKNYFWDSYFLTFGLASLSTLVATCLAFPAAYCLAFKISPQPTTLDCIPAHHSLFYQLSGQDIFLVCNSC